MMLFLEECDVLKGLNKLQLSQLVFAFQTNTFNPQDKVIQKVSVIKTIFLV